MVKYCVLEDDKVCDNCGQCNICDLDPNKICDNCMKCIKSGADYNAIEIDEIIDDGSGAEAFEQLRQDLRETDGETPFDCFKDEKKP